MLGSILDSVVRKLVQHDGTALFVLDIDGRPALVHESCREIERDGMLDRFTEGTYVLSPYFSAFKVGALLPFSVVRHYTELGLNASHIANAVLYPHVSLQPDYLADEACFALVGERRCVIYLVMRSTQRGPFAVSELQALRAKTEKICDLLEHVLTHFGDDARAVDNAPAPTFLRVAPIEKSPLSANSVESGGPSQKQIDSIFPESLSPREKVSVTMTLQGKSVDTIAQELGISPHTVRVHMRNAYGKLQVRNRLELVGMFVRRAGYLVDQTRTLAVAADGR